MGALIIREVTHTMTSCGKSLWKKGCWW